MADDQTGGRVVRRGPSRTAPRRTAASPRRFLFVVRRTFYVVVLLGLVATGLVWVALTSIEAPDPTKPTESSFICDAGVADGGCNYDNALTRLSAQQDRVLVGWEQLRNNPYIVPAVVAAEDRKFFEHSGIDPFGIGRAIWRDLRNQGVRQGGSTITQQYVKNAFLTSERSMIRKLKEAMLAVKIEQRFSKVEILTNYLNEIYFGRGAYGVEAASRAYFGKSVVDVDLAEAAYLAGVIRAPERADPGSQPVEATRRRRTVLDAMVEQGDITQEQHTAADARPWVPITTAPDGSVQQGTYRPRVSEKQSIGDVRTSANGEEYVLEYVRQWIGSKFGEGAAYSKGLRVYTTIDPRLQEEAYRAVYQRVLDDPKGPSGALVSVDETGAVRAFVGGRDFKTSKVNLALGTSGGGSGQPPGSTFKPFALAAFSEAGYSVRKSYFDSPAELSFPRADNGRTWTVSNYEDEELGVLTAEQMTWRSANTGYAELAREVGNDRIIDMARRLGVEAELDPKIASTVLGTQDVSPMDMVDAYSTLSRGGRHIEPFIVRRVEDASGTVLYDVSTDVDHQARQVVAEDVAKTVNSVLVGVIRRGTATGAQIRTIAAGKTGTTQNNQDAWFVGYTCHVTTAVWMGFTDVDPETGEVPALKNIRGVEGVTGGTLPAQVWRDYMNDATEGQKACDFPTTDAGAEKMNARLADRAGQPPSTTVRPAGPSGATGSTGAPGASTTTVPGGATTAGPSSSTTEPAPSTTSAARSTTTAPRSTTTAARPTTTDEAPPTTAAG